MCAYILNIILVRSTCCWCGFIWLDRYVSWSYCRWESVKLLYIVVVFTHNTWIHHKPFGCDLLYHIIHHHHTYLLSAEASAGQRGQLQVYCKKHSLSLSRKPYVTKQIKDCINWAKIALNAQELRSVQKELKQHLRVAKKWQTELRGIC